MTASLIDQLQLLSDRLERLEAANGVGHDDLDINQIFRSSVTHALLLKAQRVSGRGKSLPTLSKLQYKARGLVERLRSDLARMTTPAAPEVVMILQRAPLIGSGAPGLNPLFDPLADALEAGGRQPQAVYYDATPAELRRTRRPAIGMRAVAERCYAEAHRSAERDPDLLALLSSWLAVLARAGLASATSAHDIAARVHATRALRDVFADWLSRTPSVTHLGLTNIYTPVAWGAIAAARARGLVSFDMQHGLQGAWHHAYARGTMIDAPGRSSLRPDGYLCWDDVSAAWLRAQQGNEARVHVMGVANCHLARMLEGAAGAGAMWDPGLPTPDPDRPVLGLFLQFRQDTTWCRAFATAVGRPHVLLLRNHPGQPKQARVRAADVGPHAIDADRMPLWSLLARLDCVVTGYSSVTIEALAAGRPVVAASEIAPYFLADYAASASAPLVFTSEAPEEAAAAALTVVHRLQNAPTMGQNCGGNLSEAVLWLLQLKSRYEQ